MTKESEALKEELRFNELIKSANGDQLITLVSTRVDALTDKYTRSLKDKVTALEEQSGNLQDMLRTKSKHLEVSTKHNEEARAELKLWRDYVFKLGYPQGSYSDELMRKWLDEHLAGSHFDETCLQVKNPEKRRQRMEKALASYGEKVSTPLLRLDAIRSFRKALLAPAMLRIKDLEESLVAAQTYAPVDKLKAEQRISNLENELTVEINTRSQDLKAWRAWCDGYVTPKECTHEELRERMDVFIMQLVKTREAVETRPLPVQPFELSTNEQESLKLVATRYKDWVRGVKAGEDLSELETDLIQYSVPFLLALVQKIWPWVFEPKYLSDEQLAAIADKALYVDEQDTPTALNTARKALVLLRDALQGREKE